jgi:hypothetical protein
MRIADLAPDETFIIVGGDPRPVRPSAQCVWKRSWGAEVRSLCLYDGLLVALPLDTEVVQVLL